MIDWLALAWTVSSAITLVIAAVGVWDALKDLRALDGYPNGRRTVYRMHLRNQGARVVIGVLWTGLGIPLLFDDRLVTFSVPVVFLIIGNILLAGNAALDLRARRRLLSTEVAHQTADAQHEQLMAQGVSAAGKADAAYEAANDVSLKIADLNIRLIEQGDRAVVEIARTDSHQSVQDAEIADHEERLP